MWGPTRNLKGGGITPFVSTPLPLLLRFSFFLHCVTLSLTFSPMPVILFAPYHLSFFFLSPYPLLFLLPPQAPPHSLPSPLLCSLPQAVPSEPAVFPPSQPLSVAHLEPAVLQHVQAIFCRFSCKPKGTPKLVETSVQGKCSPICRFRYPKI